MFNAVAQGMLLAQPSRKNVQMLLFKRFFYKLLWTIDNMQIKIVVSLMLVCTFCSIDSGTLATVCKNVKLKCLGIIIFVETMLLAGTYAR